MRNLFALVDDESPLRRLPMDQAVQRQLSEAFVAQAQRFLSDDTERVEFDGRYVPDDGEVLFIKDFKLDPKLQAVLASPLTCDSLDLRKDPETDLPRIRGVISSPVGGNGDIFVQVFERRQLLSQKGLTLFHSGATYRRLTEPGLVLGQSLDAVIAGTDLCFASFFHARRLFNLSSYFAEATNQDVDEFADAELFHVENKSVLQSNADSWVRRKVRLIKDSGVLNSVSAKQVEAKAKEFGVVVKTVRRDGKMRVVLPPSKADLKMVLRLLDDDCFEGLLSGTHFISNSKRKV